MPARRLTLFAIPDLKLVEPGDDLAALVLAALARTGEALETGDVVVFAQKVVSKAEGRFVDLAAVTPGAEALRLAAEVQKDPRLVEIVLQQSRRVVRSQPGVLIVEHRRGWVMANAGVDHSNVGGTDQVLLLPVDPDASAAALRDALVQGGGCRVAVVVNDSFGRAWRHGTVGVALGVAGMPALLDRRGDPDLFGRPLRVSIVGHADEVAAAASLLMGPADEAQPVVIVRGLPLTAAPNTTAAAMLRPATEDLFR